MTFEAKTLVPLPCDPDAINGTFEDAADGGITLLEAPPGYALTEGLALAFSGLGRQPLWLRLGPEDSPKLRVLKMSRPPLVCAFAPDLAAVPGYFRRVSGMAAPMRLKASRWRLVGSVRTGTEACVPAKRSSLRVSVPRWASSPW